MTFTKYWNNDLTDIYNGDCVEVMQNLINNNTKIDKVITSPPYNIIRPNCSDRGYDIYKDRLMSNEQYIEWIINIFNLYDKLLNKTGALFGICHMDVKILN